MPNITFGIIVLNGEPFTRYCLRQIYPSAHQIIVVEGASPAAREVSTSDGHSIDGTLQVLRDFQQHEDPDHKVTIVTAEDEGYPDGFWPGEKDEQSRAYANRATGDYLWQVDIDEFYRARDIERIRSILAQDPTISGMSFYLKNFWGGFDYLVDGWSYRHQIRMMGGIRRLFKWGPQYQYISHRPPTVMDAEGNDTFQQNWIPAQESARHDIFCYHYGMVFPKQARMKASYYGRLGWSTHKDMNQWLETSFLNLTRPFRILHGTPPPSWIYRFKGEHPEQIIQLTRDLDTGLFDIQQRKTADIDALLNSSTYGFVCRLLDRLYPVLTPFTANHPRKAVGNACKKLIRSIESLVISPKTITRWKAISPPHTRCGINVSEKQNILIIRLDEIGDCVLTIPLIRELKRIYPNVSITLLIHPKSQNLFQNCPHIDNIITYEDGTSGRLWRLRRVINAFSFSRKYLKPLGFHIAINPRWDTDYHGAAYLAYFSGAPIRIGYSEAVSPSKQKDNRNYDRLFSAILYDTAPRHEVIRNLKIIESMNGAAPIDDHLELYISQEEQERADLIRAESTILDSPLTIAIFPGAGSKNRQWPLCNYIQLGNWLISEYKAQIVIIGGDEERESARLLKQSISGNIVDLSGKTTLNQTAAILKRCHVYIGSDSGPMHLAATVGTPVIEISCHPKNSDPNHPNSPLRFGPWKVPHVILQPENALPPCKDGCSAAVAHCITQITLHHVTNAFKELHNAFRHEGVKYGPIR